MKLEKMLNKKKLEGYRGQNIKYGAELCLKHQDSGLFLAAKDSCSMFDKSAFSIHITDVLSPYMVFQVQAEQSYRNTDDLVFN